MIEALSMIHGNNQLHRDLKPGNIFLMHLNGVKDINNLVPKLGDFGLARQVTKKEHLKLTADRGTYPYMPPERLILENGEVPKYGLSTDMWAMGVILLEMFRGEHPFDFNVEKIKVANYGTLPTYISEETEELIKNLLKVDTADRLTCYGVKQQFKIMRLQGQLQ